MIDPIIKNILNTRLHNEILNLGRIDAANYTRSKADMQPVLERLAQDGWQINGWTDRIDGVQSIPWDVADHIRLRRVMMLTRTRTPEHQDLVESLPVSEGGVPAGDDGTYEGGLQQLFTSEINGTFDVDGSPVVIDEQPSMVAILSLSAKGKGPRPPNWIRDI